MIEYCEIRVTVDHVCNVESGKLKNLVRRSAIDRAIVNHGIQAPRPIIQAAIGIGLLGSLAWPIYRGWVVLRFGGSFWGWEAYLGGLSIVGGWLLYDAFRKGWFLRLETTGGTEKLSFSRDARPEGLKEFARRAQDEIGMVVEIAPEALDHANTA